MTEKQLREQIINYLKSMSSITKEEYDKYMEHYNKQDILLKTGPQYYYIPQEDVCIKSDIIYDLIDNILKESFSDLKSDLKGELNV